MVNLVARGAARPDGTVGSPLVHIVMSEQLIENLVTTAPDEPDLADPLERPERRPVDPGDPDGRCELIDGTPLHPHLALKALVVAAFRRQVLSAGGEIIDLGRRVRSFPPHLRRALLVAARGRWAVTGCSSGFAWLQANHIIRWIREGPTALHNGQDPLPDPQPDEGRVG